VLARWRDATVLRVSRPRNLSAFRLVRAIAVAGCAVSWLGIATDNDQAWAMGGLVGLVALMVGLWMMHWRAE
jgi:hypothetical protein